MYPDYKSVPTSGINLWFRDMLGTFYSSREFSFQEFGFHSASKPCIQVVSPTNSLGTRLHTVASQRVVTELWTMKALLRSFPRVYPANTGLSLIPRSEEPGNEAGFELSNHI